MQSFKQRLHFDADAGTIADGDRRYLMLRADVLMGMLHALPAGQQAVVLAALADSAFQHGGASVQAYRAEGGHAALVATMVDGAATLGWGTWQVAVLPAQVELVVGNSPFAHGHGPAGHAVCAPISGIFRSMAGALLGCAVSVTEYQCAAHQGACCRFRAVPAA